MSKTGIKEMQSGSHMAARSLAEQCPNDPVNVGTAMDSSYDLVPVKREDSSYGEAVNLMLAACCTMANPSSNIVLGKRPTSSRLASKKVFHLFCEIFGAD